MKVLIDAHMVGSREGGNERYIVSLIAALGKIVEVHALVARPGIKLPGAKRKIQVAGSNLARYLSEIPHIMKRGNYDLVLTTYFVAPACAKSNVVMVHDLLPLRKPEYFSLKERIQFLALGYSIKKARGVIVPSRFIAEEIKYFYPDQSHKVQVIPEAADSIFKPYSARQRVAIRKQYKLSQLSVLILASRFAKRPIQPVLAGLALLEQPVSALVMGKPKDREKQSYGQVEVRYLDHVSDTKLCDLYNGVDLVIYPSRYEGFGLPVLEAMACKTVVLANRISPVVASVGKAAIYFELDNPSSLAKAIEKVVSDKEYRSEKIKLGYNAARSFSWVKTAKQTKAAFIKIMGNL